MAHGRDLSRILLRSNNLPRRKICTGLAASGFSVLVGNRSSSAEVAKPLTPEEGARFALEKDWTFGIRDNASIKSKADLDREFFFRYIYNNGTLDQLPTYWSYHRDYADDDSRSLHVFTNNGLILKGRIPSGGGLFNRGIESGMLRAKIPVEPNMFVEMRAKLPRGIGAWPGFWLNPGIEFADGSFSPLPWPPEIDIFEFMNFQGHPRTDAMMCNVQVNNHPEQYGQPHDIFTLFKAQLYTPGADFSEDFHVFGLDWHIDRPAWLLDGHVIKQTYYEWRAPSAHLLVTNQLGINLPGADMKEMSADERQWDYTIDFIRVWRRAGAND